MWIIIILILIVGLTAVLAVSEKKRKEKARERAAERRKRRAELLAKAQHDSKNAFRNEFQEDETEEELSEELEMEPVRVRPASKQERLSRIADSQMDLREEHVSDDVTWREPIKPVSTEMPREEQKRVIKEAALDVLTERYEYIKDEPEEEEEEEKPVKKWAVSFWILGALVCIVLVVLIAYFFLRPAARESMAQAGSTATADSPVNTGNENQSTADSTVSQNDSAAGQESAVFTTLAEAPHSVSGTDPDEWGIVWEIFTQEGTITDSFQRSGETHFQNPASYFALPGIATFRGNNFRDSASYGTAQIVSKTFSDAVWSQGTGALSTSDGSSSWTGSGWTGQPLIVQWDADTRRIMTSMYEEKRAKDGLVEVIYATLDGNIYFLDLEDGSYTRDPLQIGMTFKGSGALDPRGYPLMYVGSGDYTVNGSSPHMYVISLIDGSILYEYGQYDPAAQRSWCAFDSSPLVDANTDTLIWPGENGIFYTIHLNTQYDPAAGTISVDPELTARTRYASSRSGSASYWLGMECSVSVIDHYAYYSENGGMFYCMDLNTMEVVWAQDTKDDSNSSPVVSFDSNTGRAYVYTAPSLHWTAEGGFGSISIYKLDAITGEILWEHEYDCETVDGVSGGVQATPVLGRKGTTMENLIIYPIARTPDTWSGRMVALDQETGEEVWYWEMDSYAWSSPVAVYTEDGTGYLIAFDSAGYGYLLDGATGQVLDSINVGSLVEASPAVYENRIIIGTRGQQIYAIDLQ